MGTFNKDDVAVIHQIDIGDFLEFDDNNKINSGVHKA